MNENTSLLVATVRNEGHTILEWVAHHRLCGFDRIQLYQNDSTDTTVRTLQVLADLGVVEVFDNRHKKGRHQMRALRRAARSDAFARSDRCMVLDTGDYLCVKVGKGRISDLVAACPDGVDAVLVNAKVFGSSGHQYLDRSLVTERFTHGEPSGDVVSEKTAPFRALFRTEAFGQPGAHMPTAPKKDAPVICNGSGLGETDFRRKGGRSFDPKARALAQVNSYPLRDLASFLLQQGDAGGDIDRDQGLTLWRQHDRNEEEDLSLVSRGPALWDEMQRLDDLSGGQLLRLRQKSIRQWRIAARDLAERRDIAALRDAILGRKPDPLVLRQSMVKQFRLPVPLPTFSSVRRAKDPLGKGRSRKSATGF